MYNFRIWKDGVKVDLLRMSWSYRGEFIVNKKVKGITYIHFNREEKTRFIVKL